MAGPKQRDVWQYGDFQTPHALAVAVCETLSRRGIAAPAVLEPTCGRGSFVSAAADAFPAARTLLGMERNPEYVADARRLLAAQGSTLAQIEEGDFFTTDWAGVLSRDDGPWLILGNPPWVTNADLGSLDSANLPVKSNFKGHRGLDAITGKANFDISEWMLLEQVNWLKRRSGWIAMLVKTSVARKILRQVWKRGDPVGRAAMFKIDAMHHFGAAVDACLFVLPVNIGLPSSNCDVYPSLDAQVPANIIGLHDNILCSNVTDYIGLRHLIAPNKEYIWRSGVKHDCSSVMELSKNDTGNFVNGRGEQVCAENSHVFPMLKSSDVANGRLQTNRFMIVTQRAIGNNTSEIRNLAPKMWDYLIDHADLLDARKSVIYRNKPRFSVFGVGKYTFLPWKIAISGFYKNLRFVKVGPKDGCPTVFDDTIYFLACHSEDEANFILHLVQSELFTTLICAMIFHDEKRPITAEILKRISLDRLADQMSLGDEYRRYSRGSTAGQLELAIGA